MFKRKITKGKNDLNYDIKFYQMLLKYEKRNPNFNVKKVFKKLYPLHDIDFINLLSKSK